MTHALRKLIRAAAGAVLAGLKALALAPRPALAQPRPLYDISYRWSAELPSVLAYRRQMTHVFGRPFVRRLTVVKWGPNYGLIYRRRGYFRSAAKTARRHSDILTRHGLYPASIIEVRPWAPVAAPRVSGPRIVRRRARSALPAKIAAAAAAKIQAAPSTLETEIVSYVENLRRRGAIKGNERTAWSIYDLTSNTSLVSINEDVPFETASLVKPFIALAFFREVSDGRLRYTAYARRRMQAMIQESDNASADYFLRKMGGPTAVQRLLMKDYGGLLSGLRLVEYIPYNGRTYRNKASAHDYSRFLYALWNKQLPSSDELMRLMSLPKPNRLFTAALPPSTQVYDKTGTTSRLCGDMGILVVRHGTREYPYIVVGIIQKSRRAYPYMRWMSRRGNVIRQVSDFAYDAIAGLHGFAPVLSASAAEPARNPGLE